ncbi:transposase [Cyanobium sp. LEGE 06143]|nr:transposase [Cyanobium sp. LEGE 06143]
MRAEEKKQFLDDQRQRNAVEGKLGQGKRRYGLDLIREKLARTQGSAIALNVFVMNLEKLFELLSLLACWLQLYMDHSAGSSREMAMVSINR